MTEHDDEITRRTFLERAARTSVAGAAAPYLVPAATLGGRGRTAANDRIQLGLIGCGSMGMANLEACARHDDVAVTALCDVWAERRERARARFPDTARAYADYRELLAADDVDAVIVATPPHWHALQAVAACEAGVDLYLQKPMTLYPAESLVVRNAVRRHDRICQVGTQIHAGQNYRRVVEAVRAGALGRVSSARTFNVMNQGPEGLGHPADGPPPAGLDWEAWVGPAPMRPFNEVVVRDAYHHCSFWDYSGGWTPGMAPHIVDLPFWALGLGYPRETSCAGGRFVLRDLGDVPDVQEVLWRFDDVVVSWTMSMVNSFAYDFGRGSAARRLGIYLHGADATLIADYGKHEIVRERPAEERVEVEPIPPSPGHEREWLDCLRTRQRPSCDPEYHGHIDVAIGLANLAYRLGRSVRFDPVTERIVGDAEAARLARPEYRAPWRFPEGYMNAG